VELMFSSFVSMLWMVILAGVISCITLWSLKLRDSQLIHEQTEAKVRTYLKENKISAGVGNSLVRFARTYASKLRVKMTDADIPIFKDLPLHVRVQLHRQIYGPVLRTHPALSVMSGISRDSICHLACSNVHYIAGQVAFEKGEAAKRMIYVRSGELSYYQTSRREPWPVKVGAWAGEVALWRRWTHVGSLIARTTSEVTSIDCARFNDILAESAYSGVDISAIRAYARLATAYFEAKGSFTDLWAYDDYVGLIVDRTLSDALSAHASMRLPGRPGR